MDRISRLRDLVDQALAQLSLPTLLSHHEYSIVATLHEIARELSALHDDRRRADGGEDSR